MRVSEPVTLFLGIDKVFGNCAVSQFGTTIVQFYILCTLISEGGCNAKQLSNILEYNYTTIIEACRKLEERGHIEQAEDDTDARKVNYRITPSGTEINMALDIAFVRLVADLWNDFPPKERGAAFRESHAPLSQVNKVRWLGENVRGDSAFMNIAAEMKRLLHRSFSLEHCTPLEGRALLLLLENEGPLAPTTIARMLMSQPSSISRTLGSLRERGLTTNTESLTRKRTLCALTEAGRQVALRLQDAISVLIADRFGEHPEKGVLLGSALPTLLKRLDALDRP